MELPKSKADVLAALKLDTPLNRARLAFSSHCAKIEQANAQRTPLDPIEWRKMEFEAVAAIALALGIPSTRPMPTAKDFATTRGYVEFYADGEEAPCERITLQIDEIDGDGCVCFSLYAGGDLHDGHTSLPDVARAFPMVAVDLDDWKAGRLVPFAVVRDAAFALAGIVDPDAEEGDT